MYFGIVASYHGYVNISFGALWMLRQTAGHVGLNPFGIQPSTCYIVTPICCQGYVYTSVLVHSHITRVYTPLRNPSEVKCKKLTCMLKSLRKLTPEAWNTYGNSQHINLIQRLLSRYPNFLTFLLILTSPAIVFSVSNYI